jgi:hypothetical protein
MYAPILNQAVKEAISVANEASGIFLDQPAPDRGEQMDRLMADLTQLADLLRQREKTIFEWADRIEASTVHIRESILTQEGMTPEIYAIATAPLIELLELTSKGAFAEVDKVKAQFSKSKQSRAKNFIPWTAKPTAWLANFCIDMCVLIRSFGSELDEGAEVTGSFENMDDLANYLRGL